MAIPKILGAQRDFSAGELDVEMKRADENPLFKLGARQLANFRILNSHAVKNRPGRTALFLENGRVEEVLMSPGNKFFIVMGTGYLRVYNFAGARVFNSTVRGDGTAIPWTATSARQAVIAQNKLDIYIAYADGFPANAPQVLTWDGVSQTSTWSLVNFSEAFFGGQKQTVFDRLSPANVTLNPTAGTGETITTVSQAGVFTPASIGTRVSYCGRQAIVTGIRADSSPNLTLTNKTGANFAANDRLVGQTSGCVLGIAAITTQTSLTVTLRSNALPIVGETLQDQNNSAAAKVSSFTVGGGTSINLTCAETLPGSQTLTGTVTGQLNIGDLLVSTSGNSRAVVFSSGAAQGMSIQSNAPQSGPIVGQAITDSSGGAGTVISEGTVTLSGGLYFTPINVAVTSAFTNGATTTVKDANGAVVLTGASVGVVGTGTSIQIQLLPGPDGIVHPPVSGTVLIGPVGQIALTAAPAAGGPGPVATWADEVMNSTLRGYPSSVSFDQNRLILSNIPAKPSGIIWSTLGLPTYMHVDALRPTQTAGDAIYQIAPQKAQVFFVIPGPESGEFVFCDSKVFYIPITVASPLSALGVVAFNILSSDGCANVAPKAVEEIIFYVNAGNLRVKAVIAPGAYYRPFNTLDTTENHTHLFSNVIALAAPAADATFPERYVYALNSNGNLIVGKYKVEDGKIVGPVGWAPWSGAGALNWVQSLLSDVIFWTTYTPNSIPAVNVIERLDDTQFLDAAMSVNNIPTALTPPGGKGPLWWLASGSVTLMDTGERMMGTYQIDVNGNIIPQFNAGENLLSAGLTAGQPWTATVEPFVADAQPGQSQHQRMFKRRVSRMAVYVSNSTGFLMARLFSGPLTRTSPALGTVMNTRRVLTWNQDDDPTKPPPLREEAQRWRPRGRAFDPRVAVIKDTPGSLTIHELGVEASI